MEESSHFYSYSFKKSKTIYHEQVNYKYNLDKFVKDCAFKKWLKNKNQCRLRQSLLIMENYCTDVWHDLENEKED